MSITIAHTSWKDVLSTEQEDNSSENRKKSKCIIIFMMMKSQEFSDLMASGNLLLHLDRARNVTIDFKRDVLCWQVFVYRVYQL